MWTIPMDMLGDETDPGAANPPEHLLERWLRKDAAWLLRVDVASTADVKRVDLVKCCPIRDVTAEGPWWLPEPIPPGFYPLVTSVALEIPCRDGPARVSAQVDVVVVVGDDPHLAYLIVDGFDAVLGDEAV